MINVINYPGVLRLQSDGKMLEKPLFYEAKLNPNKPIYGYYADFPKIPAVQSPNVN